MTAEKALPLRSRLLNVAAVIYVGVGPILLLDDPPAWLSEPMREHPWALVLAALWFVAMIRLLMLADPPNPPEKG